MSFPCLETYDPLDGECFINVQLLLHVSNGDGQSLNNKFSTLSTVFKKEKREGKREARKQEVWREEGEGNITHLSTKRTSRAVTMSGLIY